MDFSWSLMVSLAINDIGDYGNAHSQYEKAVQSLGDFKGTDKEIQAHTRACQEGYIRMVFAIGDVIKGVSLLSNLTEKQLITDCIEFLLPLKMYEEAGQLYEKIQDWDSAAEAYIKG